MGTRTESPNADSVSVKGVSTSRRDGARWVDYVLGSWVVLSESESEVVAGIAVLASFEVELGLAGPQVG